MEENMQMEDVQTGKKSSYIWIILAVLVVLGGYLLSRERGTPAPESTVLSASPVPAALTTSTESSVKVFQLDASDYSYSPNLITVKKGDQVRITLTTNEEKMKHNFALDEYKLESENAEKGSPVTFEFTASEVGEFEFYCSVYDHREKGQVGKLIVTE